MSSNTSSTNPRQVHAHDAIAKYPINIIYSSKTSGQFHSTKGNVVEGIGNVTGSSDWQQSGKQEHAAGEAEYKNAQAQGYAEGTKDRLGGKKDSIVGAMTGDKSQQTQGNIRSDKGQAQQDINKNL